MCCGLTGSGACRSQIARRDKLAGHATANQPLQLTRIALHLVVEFLSKPASNPVPVLHAPFRNGPPGPNLSNCSRVSASGGLHLPVHQACLRRTLPLLQGGRKLASLDVANVQTAFHARTSDVGDLARLVNVHGLEIFLCNRITALFEQGSFQAERMRPATLEHVWSFVLCLINRASSGETFPAGRQGRCSSCS